MLNFDINILRNKLSRFTENVSKKGRSGGQVVKWSGGQVVSSTFGLEL